MNVTVREYDAADVGRMVDIWNRVVEDGEAFPQLEYLDAETGARFFDEQSLASVAVDDDSAEVVGLYILHPNNIGRCGHIANASFAVAAEHGGKHVGFALVSDCLVQAKRLGFGVMQFNAVVASNVHARHLYERLGFVPLGVIPGGFLMKDGHYEDICPYYKLL